MTTLAGKLTSMRRPNQHRFRAGVRSFEAPRLGITLVSQLTGPRLPTVSQGVPNRDRHATSQKIAISTVTGRPGKSPQEWEQPQQRTRRLL
jgi:hypothetical protein